MHAPAETTWIAEAVQRLKHGPAGMAWTERRSLARELREVLAQGSTERSAITLVRILSADPKWEVRCEIAELLLLLPDAEFPSIAGQLGSDPNSFVRRAAKRALDRRRQTDHEAFLTRRSIDDVNRQLAMLRDKHGPATANQAVQLCDRYNEVVVGSMVHDLRSILTYFKTHCQALIDEGHKRRKAAVRVKDDIAFLERTIDDMEAFTRPAPNQRHREKVSDLISEAINLAEENTKAGTHTVTLEVEDCGSLAVTVARHLIVMALANVIKNAVEACLMGPSQSGVVSISVHEADDRIEIRVRDNGIGMSEEEKQGSSLLVPGRRNKTKRSSTGYGLPIAARNLAAHGGALSISSRENEGTTVTMTLPLDTDE